MSDRELMEEALSHANLFGMMSASHLSKGWAIEAYLRGLNRQCWGHLFDMAFYRDEAREMLAAEAKR